jgi:hypothetical protein
MSSRVLSAKSTKTLILFDRSNIFNNKGILHVHRYIDPGLPDFSWYIIQKRGKIYQLTTFQTTKKLAQFDCEKNCPTKLN